MFGAGAAFEMSQIRVQLSSKAGASHTTQNPCKRALIRSETSGGGYHAPHGCFSVFVSAMLGWSLFPRPVLTHHRLNVAIIHSSRLCRGQLANPNA